MTIHFSIKFIDDDLVYHGTRNYNVGISIIKNDIPTLVKSMKSELVKKNIEWGKNLETDIEKFVIYHFEDGEEDNLFTYTK